MTAQRHASKPRTVGLCRVRVLDVGEKGLAEIWIGKFGVDGGLKVAILVAREADAA